MRLRYALLGPGAHIVHNLWYAALHMPDCVVIRVPKEDVLDRPEKKPRLITKLIHACLGAPLRIAQKSATWCYRSIYKWVTTTKAPAPKSHTSR